MTSRKRAQTDATEAKLRSAVHAGDQEAVHDLGLLLRAQGRAREAETIYKRALERGFQDVLLDYGNLLADQPTRRKEAEELYRRALRAGDAQAHNNLAQLLTEIGRIEEAELEYRRGIKAGDLTAQRNLGLFLHEEGRFGEAKRELDIALAAGHTRVYLDLADLLDEIGSVQDAEWYRAAARRAGVPPDESPISEWRRRLRKG
jgi:uncharacterized protein